MEWFWIYLKRDVEGDIDEILYHLSDRNGEYPQRDVLTPHRHVREGAWEAGVPFQRHRDDALRGKEGEFQPLFQLLSLAAIWTSLSLSIGKLLRIIQTYSVASAQVGRLTMSHLRRTGRCDGLGTRRPDLESELSLLLPWRESFSPAPSPPSSGSRNVASCPVLFSSSASYLPLTFSSSRNWPIHPHSWITSIKFIDKI